MELEKPLIFQYPNGHHRPRVDRITLNEVEKNSLTKTYRQTVDQLKRDPKNFRCFKDLKNAEYGAFCLAADFATKLENGLINFNEEMNVAANKFVKDSSHYDLIKEFEKSPNLLKNLSLVKPLIECAEDCVNIAFQLAKHRSKTRQNENFESLKASNSRIEKAITTTDQRSISIKDDTAEIKHDITELKESLTVINRTIVDLMTLQNENFLREGAPQNVPLDPPVLEGNSLDPLWIVPRAEAEDLFNSNNERGYLTKLCSVAEILLPLKELPMVKKNEFHFVYKHFFPTKDDWEIKFFTSMKALNYKARQNLFKNIKNNRGYAITDLGYEFYYKLNSSRQVECYKDPKCSSNCRLIARQFGNMKIPVECVEFNYILVIEKRGLHAKLRKVFADGTTVLVRG